MRLTDYIENVGLWERIRGLAPLSVFDTYTPQQFDNQTDLFYGQRTVYSRMVDSSPDEVAMSVVMALKDKWVNLIAAHALGLDIASGVVKVIDTTNTTNSNRTNESNTVDKVSAFNSDALLDDRGHTINASETGVSELTGQNKSSEKSIKTAFDNLSLLSQYSIINTMVSDMANHITLSVY